MASFEEINKYYKFPLKLDDKNIYVLTKDNKPAFNVLSDDVKFNNHIIDKINGKARKSLGDTFHIDYPFIRADKDDKKVLMARGWGMLTGWGGFGLSSDKAHKIQLSLLEYCCDKLNQGNKEKKKND